MSPHTSCDLIAIKSGQILRVEVTTGYRNDYTGSGVSRNKRKEDDPSNDVVAVVCNGPDEIYYFPKSPKFEPDPPARSRARTP
jgi:hypothetical protein